MSISVDGQICFGFLFEDDYEFPWDLEPQDNPYEDLDDWWVYCVKGFKHSFEIYEGRDYLGGIKPADDKIFAYHGEYKKFLEENPVPVELLNCCSGDRPQYILTIKRSCLTANCGEPATFNPETLKVDNSEVEKLKAFVAEHKLEPKSGPSWWLCSYYG